MDRLSSGNGYNQQNLGGGKSESTLADGNNFQQRDYNSNTTQGLYSNNSSVWEGEPSTSTSDGWNGWQGFQWGANYEVVNLQSEGSLVQDSGNVGSGTYF